MSNLIDGAKPTRTYWLASVAAMVWNLIGVMSYLMSVSISPEVLAAMPAPERALVSNVPAWVTSAYAVAVFSGALASLSLLLRKGWAVAASVVSLIAILLQMGHALFVSALLEVRGAAGAALPLLIVVVAIWLVWFSRAARNRGWIG